MIPGTTKASYIVSHSCIDVLNATHDAAAFDQPSNRSFRVIELTGLIPGMTAEVVRGNVQSRAAVWRIEKLNVWESDNATVDGTDVRDDRHVVDFAEDHPHALERLDERQCLAVNSYTRRGYSEIEVAGAFEKASGCSIPCVIAAGRPSSIAACHAAPYMTEELLNWYAYRDKDAMCKDNLQWRDNPEGLGQL